MTIIANVSYGRDVKELDALLVGIGASLEPLDFPKDEVVLKMTGMDWCLIYPETGRFIFRSHDIRLDEAWVRGAAHNHLLTPASEDLVKSWTEGCVRAACWNEFRQALPFVFQWKEWNEEALKRAFTRLGNLVPGAFAELEGFARTVRDRGMQEVLRRLLDEARPEMAV